MMTATSLLGCSTSGGTDESSTTTKSTTTTTAPTTTTASPTTTTTSPTAGLLQAVCGGAPQITDAGVITAPQITEASGLVASRTQPGVWWVHNDSGDSSRVFAIGDTGALLGVTMLAGAGALDWEDIAIGPGSSPEDPWNLYVGDIGDNAMLANNLAAARQSLQVYRFAEPTESTGVTTTEQPPAVAVDTLNLVYPDGPHDAESLLVDPIDDDLVIITKDWSRAGASEVYRVPADLEDGSTTTLEHVGTVAIEPGTLVTGADVSPDGSVVALRSYGAVELYSRPAGSPLWAAFDSVPCAGPVPGETQGESIAFSPDGSSYTTVSEGDQPVLHRTSR